MDRALSFLISAAIAAFGVLTVIFTIASGLPLSWALMGLLAIISGLISLYLAIGEARSVR
ncbi:hypothetical protein AB7M69_001437 [Bradyrhizobium japonicum]